MPLRIAIRSDRSLFADALALSLAGVPGVSVMGQVTTVADLVALYEACRPDLVLFDLGAGNHDAGLVDLSSARRRCPQMYLVAVYDQLEEVELAQVSQAGADAAVSATQGLDVLVTVLDQRVHESVTAGASAATVALNDQEREIMTLVSTGHTAESIAELLQLSVPVVARRKRRVYHKLDVVCQSQAVARLAALGLVDWTPTLPGGGDQRWLRQRVVLLLGRDSELRREVAATLTRQGIVFVETAAESDSGQGVQQPAEFVAQIVVDPQPGELMGKVDRFGPVVVVRAHPGTEAEALGRGVVAADRVAEDLVCVLLLAIRGYVVLDAAAVRPVLDAAWTAWSGGVPRPPALTVRERDILRSIARGDTVRMTARSLGIAPKTVENTQARLFRKLGVRNRVGAIAAAHALGLLDTPAGPGGLPPG